MFLYAQYSIVVFMTFIHLMSALHIVSKSYIFAFIDGPFIS
jgi:hypothetical protein